MRIKKLLPELLPGAVSLSIALTMASMFSTPAFADIFERNARLGRGVNFGNALEAPKEGEWGLTLKEDYFRLISEAGFKSVRLPIKWSGHAAAQSPFALDETFLARIDWAVAQALKYGLAPIINVHHYDEMAVEPAAHKERWLGIWKQIATHYQDQSKDVYFEIMNEPNGSLTAPLWNGFIKEALALIRAANPDRAVIVGPVDWNNVGRLKDLVIPSEESNVIVTFHYYLPFQFTHQGAEWVTGSNAWLGTAWAEKDQAAVEKDFQTAKAYGDANKRPIQVGEFGSYSKADQASRLRWTSFVARTAENSGFSWAYWEFGAGFGIYDSAAGKWREDLKNALVGPPLALAKTVMGAVSGPKPIRRIALDPAGRPASGLQVRSPGGRWTDLQGRPRNGGDPDQQIAVPAR